MVADTLTSYKYVDKSAIAYLIVCGIEVIVLAAPKWIQFGADSYFISAVDKLLADKICFFFCFCKILS